MERSSANIYNKGSERAAIYEVTSLGVAAGGAALMCLPLIASSKFNYEVAQDETKTEGGTKYYSEGDITSDGELVFAARDAATLMMALLTLRGKYWRLCKEMNQSAINGRYNYLIAPIVQFQVKAEISNPSNTMTVPFKMLPTPSAMDIDTTVFASTNHGFAQTLTCTKLPFAIDSCFCVSGHLY